MVKFIKFVKIKGHLLFHFEFYLFITYSPLIGKVWSVRPVPEIKSEKFVSPTAL